MGSKLNVAKSKSRVACSRKRTCNFRQTHEKSSSNSAKKTPKIKFTIKWFACFLIISGKLLAQSLTPEISKPAITILAFSAFTCGYCAKSAKILNELRKKYPTQLAIQFSNFPLSLSESDLSMHLSGVAAQNQGGFDKFYWFANQGENINLYTSTEIASALNFDAVKFEADQNNPNTMASILDDIQKAAALGVKVTPTIFIDGIKLEGLVDKATLITIIESHLVNNKE